MIGPEHPDRSSFARPSLFGRQPDGRRIFWKCRAPRVRSRRRRPSWAGMRSISGGQRAAPSRTRARDRAPRRAQATTRPCGGAGYEVPFVEPTRCEDQWAPYREYHPASTRRSATQRNWRKTRWSCESGRGGGRRRGDPSPLRRAICPREPEYDLYLTPDPAVTKNLAAVAEKWGHLLDCLFRYFDGRTTILDIAERPTCPSTACADISTASTAGWSASSGPRSAANRRRAPAIPRRRPMKRGCRLPIRNQLAKPVERCAGNRQRCRHKRCRSAVAAGRTAEKRGAAHSALIVEHP